ncbi:MAG TPA: ABC transporter permease [Candidatus Saccharimonadales bacterium]|nr:ABC transporter permease [Candidatus Saccharimonadales bacterium]
MSLQVRSNFKVAMTSIRATKWRSLLTMLGIIVGIVSVVLIVGIGEGVKRQVASQVSHFGSDLITIRPGNVQAKDSEDLVLDNDVLFGRNALSGLTMNDIKAVQAADHVGSVAPLGTVSGAVGVDKTDHSNMLVLATSPDLPVILDHHVLYGSFFSDQSPANSAVIGKKVAADLFGTKAPLGQVFTVRGQPFIVRGVFDAFDATPLSPTARFDDAIFIPYQTADRITSGTTQFYGILAKPDKPTALHATITSVNDSLKKARGGATDFTVLDESANSALGRSVVDILTGFIVFVAGIALFVGGVGIMNIMLVSVTERMYEIGVRKAIGATNGQILGQFIMEAAVLSGTGGLAGVLCSIIIAWLVRTYTDYSPVITLRPVIIATAVSVIIGVAFGLLPAIKAARKDPIAALRHE